MSVDFFVLFMVLCSYLLVSKAYEQCEVFNVQLDVYDSDNTTVLFNETLSINASSIVSCDQLVITVNSDLRGPDGTNETATLAYVAPREETSSAPWIAATVVGVTVGSIAATVGILKAMTFLKAGTYHVAASNPSDGIQFKNL